MFNKIKYYHFYTVEGYSVNIAKDNVILTREKVELENGNVKLQYVVANVHNDSIFWKVNQATYYAILEDRRRSSKFVVTEIGQDEG